MTIIELLIVIAIIATVSAIAIPELTSARRLYRSAGIAREIFTELRFARQQAMSQRQVFTFRYDNVSKQISIIDHQETGITYDPVSGNMVRIDGSTTLTANEKPDVTVRTIPLSGGGVPAGDIAYGKPAGIPAGALDDSTTMSQLVNGQINVAFQPDGSVLDSNRNPINHALFICNKQSPTATASAISVLGSAGRIKLWRYDGNAKRYIE